MIPWVDFLNQGAFLIKGDDVFIWTYKESLLAQEKTFGWQSFFGSQFHLMPFKRIGQFRRDVFINEINAYSQKQETFEKSFEWELPEQDPLFEDQFIKISNKIKKGALQKAVPIHFIQSSQVPSQKDKIQLLKNLLKAPHNLYGYGFWYQDQGIMGATPEILYERNGETYRSMALAGTLPKGEVSLRVPLLEDVKEMKEHDWVLEDLYTQLSRFGSVQIKPREVVELPHLYHLKTEIVGQLKVPYKFKEWIEALHPTPALGVAPRSFDFNQLSQFDLQKKRQFFGCPFWFQLSPIHDLVLVGIRNVMWLGGKSRIGAGVGQTNLSEMNREWKEIQSKQLSVIKLLFGESYVIKSQ